MSGSGGGGGYEYQARATAYVAAHILAQQQLNWIEYEKLDVPIAVAEETGGVGDDLSIMLQGEIQIELQAKHGLQKNKLWEPLLKLGHGLQENSQFYGVLLTDSTASKIIREDLRNDFKRLGQGRTDGLKAITQETQQEFAKANLPSTDPNFFRRLLIVVLDLDDSLQAGKHAQLLLSRILQNPNQSASAWGCLCKEGQKLISNRGCRDLRAWARLLGGQGIQLASACASVNGVRSIEETAYLQTIKERFHLWWQDSANFIDEINESTWHEFRLLVNKPKSEEKGDPLVGQNEDAPKSMPPLPILESLNPILHGHKREQILIVGKPGAGKSALLAQVLLIAAENALQDSNAPIPVLIELKSYARELNILRLIKAAFENRNFLLGILEHEKLNYIENLIKDGRLLLLVDGVNEASREAFDALKDFCKCDLSIIITSHDVISFLSEEFINGDTNTKCNVINLLGETKAFEAIPVLIQALSEDDRIVRLNAASRIGLLGVWLNRSLLDNAATALAHVLQNDSDTSVRSNAAISLGVIGDSRVVPALIEALYQEDEVVRASAIDALGQIQDPAGIQPLIHSLRDNDYVCKTAIKAPRALYASEALPKIRKLVTSKSIDIQREAILTLGFIGDPKDDAPCLYKALQDKEFSIRLCAAYSLSLLNNRKGVPILEDALKTGNKEARELALKGLKNFKGKVGLSSILSRVFKEDEFSIQRESIDFLEFFKEHPEITQQLQSSLNSSNEDICRNAMDAAKMLGNAEVLPHPRQLAETITVVERPLEAIAAIQARCGFYNYEITQLLY